MENEKKILASIAHYKNKYPGEEAGLKPVTSFLKEFKSEELFSRKNFTGHITASAYIINPVGNSILFLRHKAFNRWLQPGGHVDETDATLLDAALREAHEETGIAVTDLHLITPDYFNIDSHSIPFNAMKNEPQHVHHDISFLFKSATTELNFDEQESTAAKWVNLTDLAGDKAYQTTLKKIKGFI